LLVLTRQANQSIMIGTDIVVTVLEIRGDQVRIGVRAPRSVSVHREEVFAQLEAANRAAAAAPSHDAMAELARLRPPPVPGERGDAGTPPSPPVAPTGPA
jgi:carbon storage regulator